jgi:hypothetical protein
MILLVNGGAATSIHPNAARFYRIGTMSRQIHGAVSSSKHISLKTQHPLSDSNSGSFLSLALSVQIPWRLCVAISVTSMFH